MLFYRVCHRELLNGSKDGLFYYSGPYTIGSDENHGGRYIVSELLDMASAHAHDRNTPSVLLDFHCQIPFAGNFVCGFTSPEKLQRWFKGYFELLYEANHVVRVWDVPPAFIAQAEHQDCARRDFIALFPPVRVMDMAEFEAEELQNA